MNKSLMDMSKVDNLCKEIDDYIFKLENDMKKISDLIGILSKNFIDEKQSTIYSEIIDNDIVKLNNDFEKMKSLNSVLKKMRVAYSSVESEFSSKDIIEAGLN